MKRFAMCLCILLTGCFALGQMTLEERRQIMLDRGLNPDAGDSMANSTLVVTSMIQNGSLVDLRLMATNNSGDVEWLEDVTLEFPMGWTITAMNFVDMGGLLSNPNMTGIGGNIANWTDADAPCGESGFLGSGGGQVELTISVNTGVQVVGAIPVAWMFEGDNWGGDPHVLCSTTSSCAFDACYDTTVAPVNDLLLDFEFMVPTLGQWGLTAFAVLLGLVALVFVRKKMA